jgi:Cu+-exporting ATPase
MCCCNKSENKVKDPVCGVIIDPAKDATTSQRGKAQVEMSEQVYDRPIQKPQEHDPVCGMKVDPSKAAATVENRGTTVYFCSQGCAVKFRAAPEKYLQAKLVTAVSQPSVKTEPQRQYVCPMHPEVKQTGPGSAQSAAWRSNLVIME